MIQSKDGNICYFVFLPFLLDLATWNSIQWISFGEFITISEDACIFFPHWSYLPTKLRAKFLGVIPNQPGFVQAKKEEHFWVISVSIQTINEINKIRSTIPWTNKSNIIFPVQRIPKDEVLREHYYANYHCAYSDKLLSIGWHGDCWRRTY